VGYAGWVVGSLGGVVCVEAESVRAAGCLDGRCGV
jgi:hypothetical protein